MNARALTILSAVGAALSLAGCSKPGPAVDAGHSAPADSSRARAAFKPTLLRRSRSPQPYESLVVPEGVEQIEYFSGELALKVWSRPSSR